MTEYGIRLIAWARGAPYIGKRSGGVEWLTEFDFEVNAGTLAGGEPTYPTGDGDSSPDPDDAMRFKSAEEAWEFWRRPSTSVPTRPDGKPNRPMTVFTIAVEPLP